MKIWIRAFLRFFLGLFIGFQLYPQCDCKDGIQPGNKKQNPKIGYNFGIQY